MKVGKMTPGKRKVAASGKPQGIEPSMPRPMGRRRRRAKGRAFGALALLALVAVLAYAYTEHAPAASLPPAEGVLRVHYVAVGQGDAIVWELPGGGLVINDCGPPADDAEQNPLVRYLRDTLGRPPGARLVALVASHGHLDHVGGCEEVLALYDLESVYEAWYEGPDAPASYRRFQQEILAEKTTIHRLPELAPGIALAIPGARATLLWPPAFAPGGWDAIAEASLVVRLEHGARSFCFQGDIEAQQEAQLEGRCDVYLVGHHGSRHASSAGWLARMRPEISVVSFGENGYGHPHLEALCRVQQAGSAVYMTHRGGTVVIETDGVALRVLKGERATGDACSAGADSGVPSRAQG